MLRDRILENFVSDSVGLCASVVNRFSGIGSEITLRFDLRFPFDPRSDSLAAGGECQHEKAVDSCAVDLCSADYSGVSRGRWFKLWYPVAVPILVLQLRVETLPGTLLRAGIQQGLGL